MNEIVQGEGSTGSAKVVSAAGSVLIAKLARVLDENEQE